MKHLEKMTIIKKALCGTSGWWNRTDLGMMVFDKKYRQAAGYVDKAVKELVELGVLETNGKGKYRWKQ